MSIIVLPIDLSDDVASGSLLRRVLEGPGEYTEPVSFPEVRNGVEGRTFSVAKIKVMESPEWVPDNLYLISLDFPKPDGWRKYVNCFAQVNPETGTVSAVDVYDSGQE